MLIESMNCSCSNSDYDSSITTVSDTEFGEEQSHETSQPNQVAPPTQASLTI